MTLDSYAIRRARPDDLDRLVELVLALQDHLEGSNPGLWRMTEEARHRISRQVLGRVHAPQSWVFVAEHEGDGVVGVVFGRTATNNRYAPSRTGIVDQAYVRTEHRRQGLATRMVSDLCRVFADEGVSDVSLRFVAGNQEAAGFWSALGFAPRIVTVGAGLDAIQSRLCHIPTP